MPIYAYRCTSCGFEKDHLQKLDELPLRVCPQCGQATYDKQVTAAGFQLKGSGWYVTDFKESRKPAAPPVDKPKIPETASESTSAAGVDACAGN